VTTEKKIVLLMLLSLAFMFLWWPFEDIKEKVDIFLFRDFADLPKWIAHDIGSLCSQIILSYCIYLQSKSWKFSRVTKVLLWFAIFRLVEYLLFRGMIPMLPIVGGLCIYSLLLTFKK